LNLTDYAFHLCVAVKHGGIGFLKYDKNNPEQYTFVQLNDDSATLFTDNDLATEIRQKFIKQHGREMNIIFSYTNIKKEDVK